MAATSKSDYVVGVDLGGTKILAGVFDGATRCVSRSKMTTKAERGAAGVIGRIVRCVQDAVDECDLTLKQVKAVGIGSPGSVDSEAGRVVFAGNLGWNNIPLRKELERRLGLPVVIENDCNICIIGVHQEEFAAKPRNMVGLFVGTGIGGGLILNGKLFSGAAGMAGELGHMVIDVNGPKCTCGNRGCVEALSSRTAIFRRIQDEVKRGDKTILTEMLGDALEGLRSGDLRKALKRGDKMVTNVIEDAAHYIGVAVGNLVNIFNPELVVVGGGVMEQMAEAMMPIITETAMEGAFNGTTRGLRILPSKLGDDAGITGAAVLARRLSK
jgi:glucokinase